MEDGLPRDMKIICYHNYIFDIRFSTDCKEWIISVGSEQHIKTVDPFGGWDEWERVGIVDLTEIKH